MASEKKVWGEPDWAKTNRKLCEMFGIDPKAVDKVTIVLSPSHPPEVITRRLVILDRTAIRDDLKFILVEIDEDEVSDGD